MRDVITLQKMRTFVFMSVTIILIGTLGFLLYKVNRDPKDNTPKVQTQEYWMLLERKSNKEYLYKGVPGDRQESVSVKSFKVKTGVKGKKPTPLPQLVGRDYWNIVDKMESFDNPETAPYFLVLDVPVGESEPYGPEPYLECDGQCNWELPGYFGLHGVASDESKLSENNLGSSGCIRHTNRDITYLYNLFEPKKKPIRYYVVDM